MIIFTLPTYPWGGRGVAAPYKAARPCSKPAAPLDNLSREDSPLGTTTTTKVLARPVEEVLHGGCPPLSRTFGSEASPLEVGNYRPILYIYPVFVLV